MQLTDSVELLDLAEWERETDDVDESVLARCQGPTMDIGCGPGRMVLELTRRGVPALGIDILPEAVRRIRSNGGLALQRSVFNPLPAEGRWSSVLLLDGCVGIGGTPRKLLGRLRELIHPNGVVLVEHEPCEDALDLTAAQVRDIGGDLGPELPWALLGRTALLRAAEQAGMSVVDGWTAEQRTFAVVARQDSDLAPYTEPSS